MRIERVVIAIAVLLPATAGGVENYHTGDSLICSDCHSMHFSQRHGFQGGAVGAQPEVGSPGDWLPHGGPHGGLLKLPRDELCVACHDGTVVLGATSSPGGNIASAASTAKTALVSSVTSAAPTGLAAPPGGTLADHPFGHAGDCSACHETHGSSNYRNLKANPGGGRGGPLRVVAEKAAASGDRRGRARDATYRSGMNEWCMACHESLPGHHPVGRALYGSTSADWEDWAATSWAQANPGWIVVRVQNPQDDPSAPNSQQHDQVFCLSCHTAHGSSNPKALIYADGISIDSTCAQCHFDRY